MKRNEILIQALRELAVRCKDCEHSWEGIDGLVCSYGPCVDCYVPDDFYCANGEPKKAKTN